MTVQEWVDAYGRAWEEQDPAGAAALFTDDATYRSLIFEEPHVSPMGVAEYWTSVTAAQRDVTVRMGRPFLDGDRVAVEFWTTMQVEGEPVTLAGCLLLDFADDGRCRRLREYWNFSGDIAEPPAEWGL
jgi:ketosteroid isomerase-like protein